MVHTGVVSLYIKSGSPSVPAAKSGCSGLRIGAALPGVGVIGGDAADVDGTTGESEKELFTVGAFVLIARAMRAKIPSCLCGMACTCGLSTKELIRVRSAGDSSSASFACTDEGDGGETTTAGGVGGGGYVCDSSTDGGVAEVETSVLHIRNNAAGTCMGEAEDRGSRAIPSDLGGNVGARKRMYHPRKGLWIVHSSCDDALSWKC